MCGSVGDVREPLRVDERRAAFPTCARDGEGLRDVVTLSEPPLDRPTLTD
jgi:hypothetical protein